MIAAALVSALHVLGFGLGLGSVFVRARAFGRVPFDAAARKTALVADGVWGISALVLVPTGLARAFAGLEKGSAFYLASHGFLLKISFVILVFAIELWPMITLIRWRIADAKGQPVDVTRAPAFAILSYVEAALLVVIVVLASLMARGFGAG
jgi:putative membrane protein